MRHLLALALLVTGTAAVAQPAGVIGGDTLELGGEQIRLRLVRGAVGSGGGRAGNMG